MVAPTPPTTAYSSVLTNHWKYTPSPSTFWNSDEKLSKNLNGPANQKPNELSRLVWPLVELNRTHTIGISVNTAKTAHASVMSATVPATLKIVVGDAPRFSVALAQPRGFA